VFACKEGVHACACGVECADDSPEEEDEKRAGGINANAIGNKWTMVVAVNDALITRAAMVRAWWLDVITGMTEAKPVVLTAPNGVLLRR
jgi:hypothetical protein